VLCARALAAVDESEVQQTLSELRRVLHEHIEELRGGLRAAYTAPKISQQAAWNGSQTTAAIWRQIVHQIANENDHQRALQLSIELSRLLRETVNSGM
jgi:hypothetical protein